MRRGARMLMMTSRGNGGRMENRSEMNGNMGMNNGYSEMNGSMEDMEARRRYRRDSRGRFRSEMEGGYGEMNSGMEKGGRMREEGMRGKNYPFPVYEEEGYGMNPIGFDPNREIETNYRMNATHHTGNEMEYRSGLKMGGSAASSMTHKMNRQTAEEWIHSMKHADGGRGARWEIDDVKKLMEKKKIKCDPYEFAAILNAMYADYCGVLRKHGVESEDLYIDLAYAWLKDEDAMPNKAMLYYDCIVKK